MNMIDVSFPFRTSSSRLARAARNGRWERSLFALASCLGTLVFWVERSLNT